MRSPLLLLSLSLGLVSARRPLAGRATDDAAPLPVQERFILEAAPGASVADLARKVEANGVKVVKTFDTGDVFRGLSVESDHDNVDTLQEVREVARAWPMNRFYVAPVQASPSEEATRANWSVHWATGVDKLHEAGVYGKGVRIAVIDSGIDYNHQAVSCKSLRC